MTSTKEKLILGIEAGLAGGSVSISMEGNCIDSCEGAKYLSKSEDLLLLVEKILAANGLKKQAIGAILVSDGPGSLTGVRIGLATAKGLSDALRVPVLKISVLDALAGLADFRGDFTAALLMSKKSGIYLRDYKFENGAVTSAGGVYTERDVPGFLQRLHRGAAPSKNYVLHEELEIVSAEQINKSFSGIINIKVVRGNYAGILGAAFCVR